MADDSCDKHHIFLFTVMRNESLFVVNIGILLGLYVGFPNVPIMNRFHSDLNLTFGTIFIFCA